MRVGERIRFLRERKRLSGVQLATRAGIDQSYLSKLENAKAGFSEEGLEKIAKALGTSLPALFGGGNVEPVTLNNRNRVRILNYLQAGLPGDVIAHLNEDEVEGFVLTDAENPDDMFALVIRGTSMQPGFNEGDLIIVRRSLAPQPGDYVVAVNREGQAVFKRYKVLKNEDKGPLVFALVPLNDDFPTLRSDELELEIRGTMIEHRRYRQR